MDPNQTLYDLLIAIRDGDRTDAIACLTALSDWLSKEGAMPNYEQVLARVQGATND